jgi:hypothetical protein
MAGSFSFGRSLSSIPNTSFLNVSSPISSAAPGVSAAYQQAISQPTGASGVDPFSVGAAVLAPVIGGIFGQSAAQKQADATAKAAAEAREATEKAAKIGAQAQIAGQIGGFGLDYLTSRYEGGAGGALNRINSARDYVQRANIEANNPSVVALRSVERYENRLRNAMPGYMPPSTLFV